MWVSVFLIMILANGEPASYRTEVLEPQDSYSECKEKQREKGEAHYEKGETIYVSDCFYVDELEEEQL